MSLKNSPLSLPKAAGSRAVDIALSASEEDLRAALLEQKAVTQEQALRLLYDWSYWARPEQMPPPGDWRVWLLRPGRGFGKCLDFNTLIPTSDGKWKRNYELKEGDELLDEHMDVCRVVYAHPIQHQNICYRIKFSDGSVIVADADHLWALYEAMHTHRNGVLCTSIWTTKGIAEYYRTHDTKLFVPGVPAISGGFCGRWIKSIKQMDHSIPVRCITVDSPSHLYLAGPTYIPTHNTRAGAQWVIQRAYEGKGPITLIGQSAFDTREVMIKGPSGIIPNSPPWFKPVYESSKRLLTWPNGTVGYCFSGDEPEQQKGPNVQSGWLDEFCLAGRTLISGENGPIFIGQVRPGMRVWTRRGLRPVVRSWMTQPDAEVYDVEMSNGQTLTGTFNHPVWVRGRGFVPLGQLKRGDRLLCIAKDHAYGGMGGCGIEMNGGTTEVGRDQKKNSNFIGHCGSLPTALFRGGHTFITSTRMSKTITSGILKPSPTETTLVFTHEQWLPGVRLRKPVAPGPLRLSGSGNNENLALPHGASVCSVAQPILLMPPEAHPIAPKSASKKSAMGGLQQETGQQLKPVKSATSSLPASTSGFVPAPWNVGPLLGAADSGLRTSGLREPVLSAAPSLSPEAMSPPIAQSNVREDQEVSVVRVSLSPIRQAVYNLEVADCPEYFANGILTHNCKFRYAEETWNQFSFTLRYGDDPRVVITTTPRPLRVFKQVMDDPRTFVQGGTLYDNRANLNPDFVEDITRRFGGTRLGREMILGELLDDTPGAIFSLKVIDEHRVRPAQVPSLRQVVVGVDPSAADYDPDNEDKRGAECGIIVAGVGGGEDHGYVLHDASDMMSPHDWAEKVVAMYYKFSANYVVAEKNNGGGMVRETIHAVDDRVPVMLVWASQGKEPRAEPVSLLYEQGRVHHVGSLPDLEDQMSSFVPRDKRRQPSDRMDALVWAIKHLMLGDERMPHYDPTRHVMPRWRRPEQ